MKEKANKKVVDFTTLKVFTTGQAAEVCMVSQQTIIRNFDEGILKGFKVPGSTFRRIPRSELMNYMSQNNIPLTLISKQET